jgi:lysophospholipase L1-like esterase
MALRWLVLVLSVVLTFGGAGTALAESDPTPAPQSMAALGDSITRAFHSNCGLLNDCPENSWSTGSAVDSHAVRIGDLTGSAVRADNLAVTGAVAADIASQAANIAPDTEYVTVLVGANDACTDTVSQMTPVADFRSDIEIALDTISGVAPAADVYVVSIPDLYRLWEVGSASGSARFTWWLYGICQSMLQSPRSTQQADVQRRLTVRQRVIDFNAALEAECAEYVGTCHYDGGAVFGYPFVLSQLSTIDYFHPNVTGQQVLAAVTWDAGFTWTTGEPPANNPPLADAGPDQTVIADESGFASVVIDGSGSSDPDGDPLVYSWTLDSMSAAGATITFDLAVGSHVATLTVDDGRGGTDSDTVTVTVESSTPPPPEPTIHVGDLDGASASAPRNRWEASVTITVHDAADAPIAGITVTGVWSDAARGSASCVTDGDGTCTVTKANLKHNRSSATLTITQLDGVGAAYDAGANHDPDGDSNGTVIGVPAP